MGTSRKSGGASKQSNRRERGENLRGGNKVSRGASQGAKGDGQSARSAGKVSRGAAQGSKGIGRSSSKTSGNTQERSRVSQRGGSSRFEKLTRGELYQKAQRAGIEGRSKMSKSELIEALSGQ